MFSNIVSVILHVQRAASRDLMTVTVMTYEVKLILNGQYTKAINTESS